MEASTQRKVHYWWFRRNSYCADCVWALKETIRAKDRDPSIVDYPHPDVWPQGPLYIAPKNTVPVCAACGSRCLFKTDEEQAHGN